ncbi:MAG: hypothetical protein ACTSQD_06930 [Promethearchaeota archaeon]
MSRKTRIAMWIYSLFCAFGFIMYITNLISLEGFILISFFNAASLFYIVLCEVDPRNQNQ